MNLTNKGMIAGKGCAGDDNRYAVVVGGANMDILGCPTRQLVVGDSNPGSVSYCHGGVGRNIAENLARLGTNTSLITVVGGDNYGRDIIEYCQQLGIDTKGILQLADACTSTYLSVLNTDNDMHVAINDMAITERLSVDALKQQQTMLQGATLIVVDANLPPPALEYLFNNYADIPLFVDTVSAAKVIKLKPYLGAIHTLKPNLKEAERLCSMTVTSNNQLPELANWFHRQGVKRLFLSLGCDGVFYSDRHDQIHVPAIPIAMVNANGAGDAFVAGLAHSFMRQWPTTMAIEFAMAAAVVALSDVATINPDMSEISVNRVIKEFLC